MMTDEEICEEVLQEEESLTEILEPPTTNLKIIPDTAFNCFNTCITWAEENISAEDVIVLRNLREKVFNQGLHIAKNNPSIKDYFKINYSNVSQLCRVKGDNVKGAYASLLSLITESARHDVQLEDLLNLLQNFNICLSRNDNFNEMYKTTKPKCQALLNHICSHPPHILDVTWTLDFCVKANSSEKINTLFYLVQLHTEAYDPDESSRYVRFICTLEDLQDLILKLREMFKQIERISSL